VAWRQDVAHPALDLAHHGGPAFDRDWRDPYVFRAEGRTWLILGATLGDETVIPIYEARDDTLAAWAYRGILWRAPRAETPFFECPNLVRCGERWVLFVSPCREVAWWSGSLDLVGFRFHAERHGRVDESTHYYATQTAFAPDGRTILFGWVRNFPTGRNWNGCLGVPRRLWLDERGRLCTEPVTEVSALSSTPVPMLPRPAGDSDLAWTLEPATSYRGEVDVDLGPEGSARLHFAGVLVNISHSGVQIDEGPMIALDDPDESTRRFLVQWLFDRSLLEIFVNARVSLTRVVPYPPAGGVRVTTTGAARVMRAEVGRILA
jgi:beta-fructofuranosidase